MPRLPPCPLTMTRLRAGSARTISRAISRSNPAKPCTENDSVPGAQSCSRERPRASVGSCQRSKCWPQRARMRREIPSATTTSVFSGRCGPCCSMAPSGRQRIEVALSASRISGDVSSPTRRRVDAVMRTLSPDQRASRRAVVGDRLLRADGRLGQRRKQMVELVAGPRRLGGEIAAVVGVDRSLQRNAAGNLDPGLGKAVELGRDCWSGAARGCSRESAACAQQRHSRARHRRNRAWHWRRWYRAPRPAADRSAFCWRGPARGLPARGRG